MPPTPLYTARDDLVAFQLRYSWTGWPSGGQYQSQPTQLIEQTVSLWELDGIRLLEFRWTSEMVQLLFSAQPHVSPVFIAARAKGRLDHAIRNSGASLPFSRKVALRSIGDNSRLDVEEYIGRQVVKERFADERWADAITEMSAADEAVDLSQPSESARGRYWYNLHLVLIVQDRFRIADRDVLRTIRDGCGKVAMKRGT